MKIAIVIGDIRRAGGTERATINLANMISDEHVLHIISMAEPGEIFFHLRTKVNTIFLELSDVPKPLKNKPIWYINFYKKLKKNLSELKPDIIIGEGHNISVLLPLANKVKAKTLALEHIDFTSIPPLSRFLMRLSYSKLDAVVVLSETAKKKIMHLKSQVEIIPNSLPFQINELAALEKKQLVMVGRISKEKGYERIIPIATKMANDYPEWNILIYGKGEKQVELQNELNLNKIKNVHIMTPVKDIQKVYLDSSVLLMTSYYEAMPMVILEAQHCGLPVLGYSCEGTDSLIENGVNGFIVDTEQDFYCKLQELISSRELRLRFGKEGRKNAELYNHENIKQKWISLLKRY